MSKGTDVVAWNATMCALELALLDWAFKRSGESIASWLGPVRGHVAYTGLIDATDPQIARATAERYMQAGFTNLKVKVGVERDVERLEAVRDVAGKRCRNQGGCQWRLVGPRGCLGFESATNV